jgi:hypothetical protein
MHGVNFRCLPCSTQYFVKSGVAVVLGIAEKGTDADNADGGAIFVQTFGGCAVPG